MGGGVVDGFNGVTRRCLCSLVLSISGDHYTRNIHRCESRNVCMYSGGHTIVVSG